MKSDVINGIPVCCMQFKYMYFLNDEIRCNQWYCCNAQCPAVREVATGAFYPLATTGAYYAQNGELESQNL